MPGTALILMADEVRLRHARRLLSTGPVPALLAVERRAVLAGAGDRIWSPPAVNAALDLRYVLERMNPCGELPVEAEPQRAAVPEDFAVEGPGWDIPDHLLPVLLKAAEKRALDLAFDWPWVSMKELAGLLGVSQPRASQLVNPLEGFGLMARPRDAGGRLALTDRGLALLARRDRTSLAVAKKRWSMTPEDAQAPLDWRNVSGRNSRQLLRNVEHTTAVHAFLAALTGQARLLGWEVSQLDPPPRASRYFRHQDRMRSINPDAFGVLRKGGTAWPFFLGVGAPRRAALNHVGAPGPLPALFLFSPALRPGRLRRRHRPDPLPARGPGGDAGQEGRGAPVGLPPGGHRANGAAGPRLAHPRPMGVAPGAPAPLNHEKTGRSLSCGTAPAPHQRAGGR